MFNPLITPYKYRLIRKRIDKKRAIKILDVGCGHNSINICKKYFLFYVYDGIDKKVWKEDEYKDLTHLFLFDLESESEKINDLNEKYYDLILLSHIIEHVDNGKIILQKLLSKLSANGFIYIETPSKKTLKYPSGIGFFNFHDDPSHKKVYSYRKLSNILIKNNCKIIKAGIRRDPIRLVFYTPFFLFWNILYSLPFKRKWDVRGLWDFFGISQFVLGQMNNKIL
jgi:hypothetical protein